MSSKKIPQPVNAAQLPDRAQLLASWRDAFDTWTAPIGTGVDVTRDDSTTYRTKTRSTPWLVGSGMPVISVAGDARPHVPTTVLLTRVRVVDVEPEGAPAAALATAGAA